MSNAEKLEQIYFKWLQQEYSFTDIDDNYISISTPFIDSNYDNIELFASILGDQIILSDFGYTLFNLKAKGIDVTPVQKNKWRLLQQVLIDFGVKINPSTMTLSIETIH